MRKWGRVKRGELKVESTWGHNELRWRFPAKLLVQRAGDNREAGRWSVLCNSIQKIEKCIIKTLQHCKEIEAALGLQLVPQLCNPEVAGSSPGCQGKHRGQKQFSIFFM